jgi:hypothetical protein
VVVSNFDAHAPRVRAMLDAQGWTEMVGDHYPALEEIVREFLCQPVSKVWRFLFDLGQRESY